MSRQYPEVIDTIIARVCDGRGVPSFEGEREVRDRLTAMSECELLALYYTIDYGDRGEIYSAMSNALYPAQNVIPFRAVA